MKGIDLLEKMDQISPEYIEEADKDYRKKRPNIIPYCIGMAASIAVLVFSGVLWGRFASYSLDKEIRVNSNVASIISENGNLPPVMMIISAAFFGLFTFLLIRKLRYDR